MNYAIRDEPSLTEETPAPQTQIRTDIPQGRSSADAKLDPQVDPQAPPAPKEDAPDPAAMSQAAADIFRAVDGWGTDEDAIQAALRGRSPAEISAIRAAYADHYPGRTLDGDLRSELSGKDLAAAEAAMTADPVQSAVVSLVNAASGMGTDEDAIFQTLEGITDPQQRAAVAAAYEQRTGVSLSSMLESELSGSQLDIASALESGDVAGANAVRLDDAMNGADSFVNNYVLLGIDFGTDEAAVYAALESAKTPEEREALRAAYEERTGTALSTHLAAEMEGAELDVATSLADGDAAGAAAARVAVATEGMGTDENALYAQLKGRSQEERTAMIAAYNEHYGAAAGGTDFNDMLGQELDALDKERASQLAETGQLDPVFALNYAMTGVGTDEQMIRQQLQGRSAEEIAAFRTAYRERYGRDLDEDIGGENSGRDGFEIGQLMLGEPKTPEEQLARLDAAYEFERGSGAGIMGVAVTDMFSDSGHYLDLQHERLEALGNRVSAGEASEQDMERLDELATYQNQDVNNYQAARDSATNAAAMAGTVVVGTAVSIVTAGAAAPATVAALSALAGGGAGMAIRAGMQGDSYSNEDMAIDAATTLASAATAGVIQGGSAQAMLRGMAGVAEGAVPTMGQQMIIQAASGAAGGASSGMVGGLLNEQNYQGDFGDWAEGMAMSTGMGALQGAVGGVVTGGVQSRIGEAPMGVDPRMWAAMAGGAGGAAGGVAQSVVDPATYEGRWEDIAGRVGTNVAMNAFQEAAEGANQAAKVGSTHVNARHGNDSPTPNRNDVPVASPAAVDVRPIIPIDGLSPAPATVDVRPIIPVDGPSPAAVDVRPIIPVDGPSPAAVDVRPIIPVDGPSPAAVDVRPIIPVDGPGPSPIPVDSASSKPAVDMQPIIPVDDVHTPIGEADFLPENWNDVTQPMKAVEPETIPADWNDVTQPMKAVEPETIPADWDDVTQPMKAVEPETIPADWDDVTQPVKTDDAETIPEDWWDDTTQPFKTDDDADIIPADWDDTTQPLGTPSVEQLSAKVDWTQLEPSLAKFKEAIGQSNFDQYGSQISALRADPDLGPQLAALSDAEIIAVIGYTSSDFGPLNTALRSEDPGELERLGDYLKLADSGLEKLPSFAGEVYRGTHLSQEILDTYIPGQAKTEVAFTSTSMDPSKAFGGNVTFIIESASGKDISKVSLYGASEDEVLFRPGTNFMVLDKTESGGRVTIRMREL